MMDKNVHAVLCRFFRKCLAVLILIFLSVFSQAQVKFSATSNNRVIGKNDYLEISFTVENAASVESINPPSFQNFTVVSGPNQQSSMSNINGNVKQSVSVGFVLQPAGPGNFTIGAATAKADGKEYRSNPLTIQVTNSTSSRKNAGAGNNSTLSPFGNITLDFPTEPVSHQFDDYILKKGENVAAKIRKNLFIKIGTSKKSCYVGEPIVTTYKLYTRLKSESNVTKAPSFNGFSVSELELPDNYQLKTEKYNGRDYNVYTLRKVQLYPLQSGVLALEPVEVKNNINFLKAEYTGKQRGDIFYDILRDFANESAPGEATVQQAVTVTCDTLKIVVKPLPEAGKPATFKGAVGNFNIAASLEKNKITTDDAGSLKVIISGAGNIQLINAPNIPWPEGLEGFESKASENVDKFNVPLKGDKIFVYPFTVSKAGEYTIPPIDFTFFDIATQSYKTISTQPIRLQVEKGTGNQKMINPVQNNNNENKNIADERYAYRYYLGGGLVLLSGLLILFISRRNGHKKAHKVPAVKEMEAHEFVIPVNPLAAAEEKLSGGNSSDFFRALDMSFHHYLSHRLKIPVEELARKKINEQMDKCGVGVGTTLLINSLLEDIERNLYTPFSSEALMHEVYEKASEAVSLLDKQLC